ncbi:MAG: guanylate kinase [Candidatus Melainabacteria bacterium]
MKLLSFGHAKPPQSGISERADSAQFPQKIFIISGPCGVGKGTAIDALLKDKAVTARVHNTTPCMTRMKRPGEPEQYFLPEEEFLKERDTGNLFHWRNFDDNWYGTRLSEILERMQAGYDIVFEVVADIALQLKKKFPEQVTTIFIAPPRPELGTLYKRMLLRGNVSQSALEARMKSAVDELKLSSQFDHVLVNADNNQDDLIQRLKALVLQRKTTESKKAA